MYVFNTILLGIWIYGLYEGKFLWSYTIVMLAFLLFPILLKNILKN